METTVLTKNTDLIPHVVIVATSMETSAKRTEAVLPDDLLAGILGRLPPRSLAASRCICTSWRGLVDDRRLLLQHVLPHSVRGLFLNCLDHGKAHWFARRTKKDEGPRIHSLFRSIRRKKPYVLDHCNGLLLLEDDAACKYLCNPATRWSVLLPPCDLRGHTRMFVVFDPAAASPLPSHWEVLLMAPLEAHQEHDEQKQQQAREEKDGTLRLVDWPPQTWTCHVFSSRTMEWEERVFVRVGEALLLEEGRRGSTSGMETPSGAYCHGALYMLHCRGAYVTRLSLSTGKYRAIKSPIDLAECRGDVTSFIGRSQHGVYFAFLDHMSQLRVWTLEESHGDGTEEWLLKHHSVVNLDYEQMIGEEDDGPWIIDDRCKEALQERSVGWDSDNDNIVGMLDDDKVSASLVFLGFHPYREVVFLSADDDTGRSPAVVAYHLNSTKIQHLGNLHELAYNCGFHLGWDESFVYTPCLIRM